MKRGFSGFFIFEGEREKIDLSQGDTASLNFISDFREDAEYFPYGEMWVEERSNSALDIRYAFTGKEYDPETGLYYFGARYLDPRLGMWTTIDPPMMRGDYFSKPGDFETDHNYFYELAHDTTAKLKGHGGVFNPVNLNLYHYAGQNPVKFVDPDGNFFFLLAAPAATELGIIVGTGIAAAATTVVAKLTYDRISDSVKNYRENNKPNVPLFRAVNNKELASIRATGKFINPKGIENKYFSTTPEGAKQYAKMAEKAFGDGPFTIVGTSIAADKISPDMLANVDRGVPTIVVPTSKLNYLTRPVELGKVKK